MILTAVDTLNKIWGMISPYLAGITIGGIVSCAFYALFRFGFNKALSKVDQDKMINNAVEGAKEQIKQTTFKVDIQPVVLSEVVKATETMTTLITKTTEESNKAIKEQLDKLTAVVVALGNYFDDSIGVSESKKATYHEAVSKLDETTSAVSTDVEVKQVVIETEEDTKETTSTSKSTIR